jgi:urease accessory protein
MEMEDNTISLEVVMRYHGQTPPHDAAAKGVSSWLMKRSAALLLSLAPALAFAHHFMDGALPQTFTEGLLSGMGHPLIGLDHAAFIIGAGFALAVVAHGMWGILALICGSLIGAGLHLMGLAIPGGEWGVAISVILVAAIIVSRRQVRFSWLASGAALAGILHGHAYAESIFGAEAAPLAAYLIGFSLIQFCVAAAAFAAHRQLKVVRRLSPAVGAFVGAVGVVFLFGLIT